ncbi:MAG: thiamine phosphate synthase [Candidatus Omnitrophica bacterium]|nr:thiamine phosphate synthase [Candidatus Omnitrophota bacterium]
MQGFYFITDDALSVNGSISDVKAAVKAGVKFIQYRSKNQSVRNMYRQARELKQTAKGSIFIVNDRIDIALAVGADGVHLGQDDMPCDLARKILGPDKIIGISIHNKEQALLALKQGANYIGIGAIFPTNTKSDADVLGLEMIEQVAKIVSLPIVAIGGINLGNVKQVKAAGADAVCAISSVVTKQDVAMEISKFQELLK